MFLYGPTVSLSQHLEVDLKFLCFYDTVAILGIWYTLVCPPRKAGLDVGGARDRLFLFLVLETGCSFFSRRSGPLSSLSLQKA